MHGLWTNRLHDVNYDSQFGQPPQRKATVVRNQWMSVKLSGKKHMNLTMKFAHSQSPNDFRALYAWQSFENVPSILYMVANWSRNCGIVFSSGSFSNGYGLWLIAMINGSSCWLILVVTDRWLMAIGMGHYYLSSKVARWTNIPTTAILFIDGMFTGAPGCPLPHALHIYTTYKLTLLNI